MEAFARILLGWNVFKGIFKKIKTVSNHKLEIISEDNINTGLINLIVKFPGKYMPPKDPLVVMRECGALSNFSKEDFDIILSAILENQKRIIEKKYKKQLLLIKHQFSDQLNEPLIVYKDLSTEQIYIKPAKEIYYNIEKIKLFSSEDSACIGNIIGSYEAEKDIKTCKEKKMNNVIKFDISASKA